MTRRLHLILMIVAALVSSVAAVGTASSTAAAADPPYIPPSASWLTSLNYYRAMAGLTPVSEEPSWSAGADRHSCYMLQNGISHDEDLSKPGASTEGRLAGLNGNVAVVDSINQPARRFIEIWMTGPFHAIGMLRPGLSRVGFGRCDRADTPKWHSGATLDIRRGLIPTPPRATPILFPGNGTSTSLDRFYAETPNPLTYCGWTGTSGLPVIALMPQPVAPDVRTTITGPSGPLETCTLSEHNTDSTARAILQADRAVVALAREPLQTGLHTVTMSSAAGVVQWSFTVDPLAAEETALPIASPITAPTALDPVTPIRLVDTRDSFGTTTLVAGAVTRIQAAGTPTITAGANALSLNVTATNAAHDGYVTLWNCSAQRPVVATINMARAETVSNAAIVALDSGGGFCAFSNTSADIIVDVSGMYWPEGRGRLTPVTPQRLLDTRTGTAGVAGPVSGGGVVSLRVAGTGSVPDTAIVAMLTVTAVDNVADGFVTVWPCDQPRPLAAGLNPSIATGKATSNLVAAPLAADGTVCFYTFVATHLVVDLVGFVSPQSPARFTPSVPFRFVDTREIDRPPMNGGIRGRLTAGSTLVIPIAGQRNVSAVATAVSVNIAVVGADAAGYLTAYPCGNRPPTSNVNYAAGGVTSTAAQVQLSATGELCVYSQQTADVIVDVTGWWE